MTPTIDDRRAQACARLLHRLFQTTGIHGRTEMPEDIMPAGMEKGSLEHILFITLTVSIDYQRDADSMWASSRQTYADSATRYLYDPRALHETPLQTIIRDMQKYSLSKKPKNDAHIWRTVGVSFFKKWQSDPRNFLENCIWDASQVLHRLKKDTHTQNHRQTWDYPFL